MFSLLALNGNSKIKDILMNISYPDSLINKEIKLLSNRLKKTEFYGAQKQHVILEFPLLVKIANL